METPMDTHVGAWFRSMTVVLLTLAAWSWSEAQTTYAFKGFDVPLPNAVSTVINGVNYKTGMMAGTYIDIHGNTHGWYGTPLKATMYPFLKISGVNSKKWFVGTYQTVGIPGQETAGFILKGSELTPIIVPNCGVTIPHAVNDDGDVVGSCWDNFPWHWKDGVTTFLDPAGDTGCDSLNFIATGINKTDVISGECIDTGFRYAQGAFQFFNGSADGTKQAYLYPSGINDRGWIFGSAEDQIGAGDDFAGVAGFILKNGVIEYIEYPGSPGTGITAVHPSNGTIWGNWWGDDGIRHAFFAKPSSSTTVNNDLVAGQ